MARRPLFMDAMAAARGRKLTAGDKLILAYFAHRQGHNGESWPGLRTIAADLDIGLQTVLESTGRLVDAGLLRKLPGSGGRGHSSRYVVCLEKRSAQETISHGRNAPESRPFADAKRSAKHDETLCLAEQNTTGIHHRTDLFGISAPSTESDPPKRKAKPTKTQARQADIETIFRRWNAHAGRSVEKGEQPIHWKAHQALSPEIRDAATARLKDYAAEQICQAVDNYARVLLGAEYFWSYPWALFEFLTRKQGKAKDAPLQMAAFLPDNFIAEKYIARRFTNGQTSEPTIAEMAGCAPADVEDAPVVYGDYSED